MRAATPWWCEWLRLFYLLPPLALASARKDLLSLKIAAAGLDILPNSWCTISSCSEFWPLTAQNCHLLKRIGLHQSKPHGSGMSSPPSSPPPPDCSKVAQHCHTICAPSSGWNQAEADFNCNYIFAWHLAQSWPSNLTSLFNKSLVKNLYLRFFLSGAKTMFLMMSSFPHLFFWVPI